MADNSATAARYRVIRIPPAECEMIIRYRPAALSPGRPRGKTTRENRRAANPFGLASRIPGGRFGIVAEAAS